MVLDKPLLKIVGSRLARNRWIGFEVILVVSPFVLPALFCRVGFRCPVFGRPARPVTVAEVHPREDDQAILQCSARRRFQIGDEARWHPEESRLVEPEAADPSSSRATARHRLTKWFLIRAHSYPGQQRRRGDQNKEKSSKHSDVHRSHEFG